MNRFVTALALAALAFGFGQAEEPKECCKDKAAACGKECKPGKEGMPGKDGAKHGKHAKDCTKECTKDGKHAKDCPQAPQEKPKS